MRRKIALGILGLAVVVSGVVALVAFTAQQVNIEARVEKEIEVEAVLCDFDENPFIPGLTGPIPNPDFGKILPGTCKISSGDFGVVLPQRFYDKYIEVTLSKSFFKQSEVSDVQYDVLWECKQTNSNVWNNFSVGADGKYNKKIWNSGLLVNGETNSLGEKLDIPDCRERLPGTHALKLDAAGNPVHAGPELDGRIRDHAAVSAFPAVGFPNPFCLDKNAASGSEKFFNFAKDLQFLGQGIVDNSPGLTKCFYQIKLDAPPCIQGFNPWTDPRGGNNAPEDERKTPIDCHTNRNSVTDPQDIETFAQLGDEFKIQVYFHSVP